MELWVYGDESGTSPANLYCAVSGLIASPKWWARFDADWTRVIQAAGVSEFHAADFFGRHSARLSKRNEFAAWFDDRRADDFLDALLAVLNKHKTRVRPVGSILDNRAFFAFTWGERNFLTGGLWSRTSKRFVRSGASSKAYHIPFFNLVGDALIRAQRDCRVHFRMDENKVVENGVHQSFTWARDVEWLTEDNSLRLGIGDLHPGQSQDHPGIQAADLLAHIASATYTKTAENQRLSRDRRRALDGLWQIWGNEIDSGVIRTRGMDYILDSNLLPEDRALIRTLLSPAQKQQAK